MAHYKERVKGETSKGLEGQEWGMGGRGMGAM